MKNYYFLLGLPRAGNTLLGSLINQTPNVNVSANSVLMDVLHALDEIKSNNQYYQNFPDEKSYDNISKNVFNNYYSNYKAKNIIDRGCWGTPGNLKQIKKIIKKPKFIILYRPILECLASLVKAEQPKNISKTCDYYMSGSGLLGLNLIAIDNVIRRNEDYLFLTYDELVKNPIQVVKKIFSFIEEDYFEIDVKNLKQFSSNGIEYDDSKIKVPLHTIRTSSISKNETNIEDFLPKDVIVKYGNIRL